MAVVLVVEGEDGALEGAVAAGGLVEDWDVRLDASTLDQPGEVRRGAVCGIGHEPLGPKAEALLRSFDHPALCGHLCLSDRGPRLDIDDHRVIEVDQIVGGVSVKGGPPRRRSRARCGIGQVNALGCYRRRTAEHGIVKHFKLLSNGAARGFGRQAFFARYGSLPVDIGADQAGIDRKALGTH